MHNKNELEIIRHNRENIDLSRDQEDGRGAKAALGNDTQPAGVELGRSLCYGNKKPTV